MRAFAADLRAHGMDLIFCWPHFTDERMAQVARGQRLRVLRRSRA